MSEFGELPDRKVKPVTATDGLVYNKHGQMEGRPDEVSKLYSKIEELEQKLSELFDEEDAIHMEAGRVISEINTYKTELKEISDGL